MQILKNFKIIICVLVLTAGILGVVCLIREGNKCSYLSIGDYVSKTQYQNNEVVYSFSDSVGEYLIDNNLVSSINKEYITNNMTSKKLLEMIENGVYGVDNNNILKSIKNSKYITITLGINDLINNIKYDNDNDKLTYNKDLIIEKVNVFKHNYYNIIEGIKDVSSDTNIILVGSCFIYDDFIENLLNDAIKEVANYNGLLYIDVSNIDEVCLFENNKLYLNSNGQEVLFNKIVAKIKEIK